MPLEREEREKEIRLCLQFNDISASLYSIETLDTFEAAFLNGPISHSQSCSIRSSSNSV